MTYNGWTNYETWNVALWQDNESYETHRYWLGKSLGALQGAGGDAEQATLDLAWYMKTSYETRYRRTLNVKAGTHASDVTRDELVAVDWYEVAESHIEAALEAIEYDTDQRPILLTGGKTRPAEINDRSHFAPKEAA